MTHMQLHMQAENCTGCCLSDVVMIVSFFWLVVSEWADAQEELCLLLVMHADPGLQVAGSSPKHPSYLGGAHQAYSPQHDTGNPAHTLCQVTIPSM